MFRYASMPLGPVRLLTELGRALVKRGTEGTTERLRILKSGIKGNIDDFIAGVERQAPTGASQTQPLNIPVQWNAGISAKLPVKMVRRTVRYRAQRLQRQRLIKMARNVPTDALEAQETELQSAHERMNSMQREIDQLAESLKQSVNWQHDLINRLNELENLYAKRFPK